MRNKLLLLMTIVAVVFAGCKKENDVTFIQATIQNFQSANDGKVFIDGAHYACWHENSDDYTDQVLLNSTTADVVKNGNIYQIAVDESITNASMYYSIFPASAVSNTGIVIANTNTSNSEEGKDEPTVTATAEVTLHAVQLYEEVAGKQKVNALMAAMGDHQLNFENLCGLLEVNVTGLPTDAWINKIEVTTTNNKVLCGTGNVQFTSDGGIALGTLSGGINGGTTIKLQFDNDATETGGESGKGNGTYYLVVPPVSNTAFDISVHYRQPDASTGRTQLFTKRMKQTIASGSNGYTLSANQIAGVTFTFGTGTPAIEHLPGAYSVSSSNQVYFSRGSLKYNENNTPIWSFENNQLTYTSYNSNSTVLSTGYLPIWCSSMTQPLLHDNRHQGSIIDYGTFISPAPSTGAWRTLENTEWEFLVSRHTNGIGSPLGAVTHACYAYVQVNGENGMMLFPDLFEWPSTVQTSLIPSTINGVSSTWNDINYTTDQWSQLEDAGCIFLPAAGWWDFSPQGHGVGGFYWSSTPVSTANNNKDAYYFFFNSTNTQSGNGNNVATSLSANQSKHYGNGLLVRLVYDPNAEPWISGK